jgi:RecA/RadA recombinase
VVTQEEELLKYTAQNHLKDIWLHAIAEAQKQVELLHWWSMHSTEIMLKIRSRYWKPIISQPDNGEQALEIAENLIRSGAIDVVIDSVAALTKKVRSKVKWEILKWDFMHV